MDPTALLWITITKLTIHKQLMLELHDLDEQISSYGI